MDILRVINLHLQKQLNRDGILFIIWGWLMFYVSLAGYLERSILISHALENLINTLGFVLGMMAVGLTILYFTIRRKQVKTKTGTSLRFVWFSMFVALVFINLIQNNVLKTINFELQHPIFMVVIAFAILTTGRILGNSLIVYGGIFFGILALLSSYLILADQLLLEAIGWLVGIIIPGHLLHTGKHVFNHNTPSH